jgi:cellulose synthase/poly-beta-1,6-N-acetylglucosamine synthase-like glycosyltransferase
MSLILRNPTAVDVVTCALAGVYIVCALTLLLYAVNCYLMMYLFRRRCAREAQTNCVFLARFWAQHTDDDLPVVTTQLPIYNERNVVERLLDAVVAMDYPRAKHEIQILDDSTDDTCALVAALVEHYRARGVRIEHVRRASRQGFKAGALRHGMTCCAGEFIAIFDADFLPPPQFLRETVPFLMAEPGYAAVQTRWSHLNTRQNMLTRAQAIGLDAHFAVEQSARAWNGFYMNFNGTAGIWRKQAIEDAGGWQDDTLTEDMDLSYRAQLRGWRMKFLLDVATPGELPATITAYKCQQFRWTKGSIQTALKVLPAVLRSRDSVMKKAQAVLHLTHHVIDPLILIMALFAVPALIFFTRSVHNPWLWVALLSLFIVSSVAPASLHMFAQRTLYPQWWKRLLLIPWVSCVYTRLAINNTKALIEAMLGVQSAFVRTPKHGGGAQRVVCKYKAPHTSHIWLELGFGLYCAACFALCLALHSVLLAYFIFLYTAGFLYVGSVSLFDHWRQRAWQPETPV